MKTYPPIWLKVLLVVLILISMVGFASASEVVKSGERDGFSWTLTSDGVLTISGSGELDIREYSYWKEATAIVVEPGITAICNRTFMGLSAVREVTLPDTLTKIEVYAFADCTSLEQITIPASVNVIGQNPFSGCTSLERIQVAAGSSNFCSVDGVLFGKDMAYLISYPDKKGAVYKVPEGVTYIDDYAFKDSVTLSSVTLSDTVTGISDYAFYRASGLTEIIMGKNVRSIGNSAFYQCTNLTQVVIPDGVEVLNKYQFYGCTSLKRVVLPWHLDFISTGFYGCVGLECAVFRFDPPRVNDLAAVFPTQAENFEIQYPASRESVWLNSEWGEHFAMEAYTPAACVVAEGTWDGGDGESALTWVVDINGTLTISGTGQMSEPEFGSKYPWAGEAEYVTKVVIEEGITTVGTEAFGNFEKLEEVELPGSVTWIQSRAFSQCTALKKVTISVGTTKISDYVFRSCTALQEITIPYTVEEFGYSWENDDLFQSCPNVVIKGAGNSFAQAYAQEKGYSFVTVGQTPVTEIHLKPGTDAGSRYQVMKELQDAVRRSNVKIILADGQYEISKVLDLRGAFNVTIMAENPGKAEILQIAANQNVIQFGEKPYGLVAPAPYSCFITIEGLLIGSVYADRYVLMGDYNDDPASFFANLIYGSGGKNITIRNCDLWDGKYATVLFDCENVTVSDCILRNCSYGAVYSDHSDVRFETCIISDNGKETPETACILGKNYNEETLDTVLSFERCRFINNYSQSLLVSNCGLTESVFTDCTMKDNCWQGKTPGTYGVCWVNGVVWQAVKNESGTYDLILGKDIPYDDGTLLASGDAQMPTYSENSLPWGNLRIAEQILTPGIVAPVYEHDGKFSICADYTGCGVMAGKTCKAMCVAYTTAGKMTGIQVQEVCLDNTFRIPITQALEDNLCYRIFLLDPANYDAQTEIITFYSVG